MDRYFRRAIKPPRSGYLSAPTGVHLPSSTQPPSPGQKEDFRPRREGNRQILLRGQGGEIELRVTERLESKQRKVTSYDGTTASEPFKALTGVLRLHLEVGRFHGLAFEDAADKPLEEQLQGVFQGLYRLVVQCRITKRKSDEREKAWADEQRRRDLQERLRLEVKRREDGELRRRESLVAEAER
jgi:hypothetical protein